MHRLGLQMLLEVSRHTGAAVNFLDSSKSLDEIRDLVKRYAPDLGFLSCTMSERGCRPLRIWFAG